jgi:hypothetical protein
VCTVCLENLLHVNTDKEIKKKYYAECGQKGREKGKYRNGKHETSW